MGAGAPANTAGATSGAHFSPLPAAQQHALTTTLPSNGMQPIMQTPESGGQTEPALQMQSGAGKGGKGGQPGGGSQGGFQPGGGKGGQPGNYGSMNPYQMNPGAWNPYTAGTPYGYSPYPNPYGGYGNSYGGYPQTGGYAGPSGYGYGGMY